MRNPAIGAAALLCSVACGRSDAPSPPHPVVRDSAGIAIVENAGPAIPGVLSVNGPALLVLHGDEAGGLPFESIAAVEPIGDGRLAVADAGAARIVWFDEAGSPLGSAGGSGDGPGEFRLITAMGRGRADTLWVYDFGLRRFTLLRPATAGRPEDRPVIVNLGISLSAVSAEGMLDSGEFVVREQWSSTLDEASLPGVRRAPVAVARIGRDGTRIDTLAMVPGREVVIGSEGGRRTMATPPWARNAAIAVGGGRIHVGDQDAAEIRVYRASGALERIIRWAGAAHGSANAWADSVLEAALLEVDAADRPRRRAELAALPRPTSRPGHGRILAGPAGELWVAPWTAVGAAEPWWWVFDDTGMLHRVARLPQGFRLLRVDSTRLYGVTRDALDAERVEVFARAR